MDTKTNEVYDLEKLTLEEKKALLKKSDRDLKQVPDHLKHAAKSVLQNQKKGNVSFNSGGKLSRWANKMRQNNNKRR